MVCRNSRFSLTLVSGCDQNDALGLLESFGLEEDPVNALVRTLAPTGVEAMTMAVCHRDELWVRVLPGENKIKVRARNCSKRIVNLPSVAAIGRVELVPDLAALSTVADGQEDVHGRDLLLIILVVVVEPIFVVKPRVGTQLAIFEMGLIRITSPPGLRGVGEGGEG